VKTKRMKERRMSLKLMQKTRAMEPKQNLPCLTRGKGMTPM
jgi:hypothetical protein